MVDFFSSCPIQSTYLYQKSHEPNSEIFSSYAHFFTPLQAHE